MPGKHVCSSVNEPVEASTCQPKAAVISAVTSQPATRAVKRPREPISAATSKTKRQAVTGAEVLAAPKSKGGTVADAKARDDPEEQVFQQSTAELFATEANRAVHNTKLEVLRIMLDCWEEDTEAAGSSKKQGCFEKASTSGLFAGWYTDADVKQMREQQVPAMCSCPLPRSFCRHPSCLALYCQACERKTTEKGYDESFCRHPSRLALYCQACERKTTEKEYDESFQWCQSCYPRPCKAAPGHFSTEHFEKHLDRCQNVENCSMIRCGTEACRCCNKEFCLGCLDDGMCFECECNGGINSHEEPEPWEYL